MHAGVFRTWSLSQSPRPGFEVLHAINVLRNELVVVKLFNIRLMNDAAVKGVAQEVLVRRVTSGMHAEPMPDMSIFVICDCTMYQISSRRLATCALVTPAIRCCLSHALFWQGDASINTQRPDTTHILTSPHPHTLTSSPTPSHFCASRETLYHRGLDPYVGTFVHGSVIGVVTRASTAGDFLRHAVMDTPLGRMDENSVVARVLLPVMMALQHMHARGLVHRNVRPEYVVEGVSGVARLGGLQHVARADERPSSPIGPLDYMAPEMILVSINGWWHY